MATQKATAEFILAKLRDPKRFTVRSMFGEYALYADGTTVGFICDDRLLVKIVPASAALKPLCELGFPYPGAKSYYIVDEGQLSSLHNLPAILTAIAKTAPVKKKARKNSTAKKK
jgi:TfoX/Sxy family transcriptional regulator of competence genes